MRLHDPTNFRRLIRHRCQYCGRDFFTDKHLDVRQIHNRIVVARRAARSGCFAVDFEAPRRIGEDHREVAAR